MVQPVHEAHEVLYHYTTGLGLHGIVKTQQLWATNVSFLNDVEEQIGFFNRRLPRLVQEAMNAVLAKSGKQGLTRERAQERAEELVEAMRTVTLRFDNPFVAAFCGQPAHAPHDGLLSQWRGYGLDGGYAIVFDSKGMLNLLELTFGDVEYIDPDINWRPTYPETLEREAVVKRVAEKYIQGDNQEPLGNSELHEAVASLSCLQKHFGFREESEVRIVATPTHSEVRAIAKAIADETKDPLRTRKPISFVVKNGTLVPYIALFGRQLEGKPNKLPIRKVIVGPHADRRKRKKAVELLLEQHEVAAEVLMSEIPYIGH